MTQLVSVGLDRKLLNLLLSKEPISLLLFILLSLSQFSLFLDFSKQLEFNDHSLFLDNMNEEIPTIKLFGHLVLFLMTNPSLLSTDQNPRFRDSIRNAREGLPTFFGSLLLVCIVASPFLPKADRNSVAVASFNNSNYTTARLTTQLQLRPLLPLLPIAVVATSILLFALFLPHGGPLTRFLHQVGARYLFFYLLVSTSGLVLRFEDVTNTSLLAIIQDDALFPRFFTLITTLLLATFFYGIAERFVFARSGDREFPLLLLLLHLGGLLAVRLHTLIDILLALERVTLATYVLLAIERHNRFSTYSGVQAFLLGSVPSALLLVGCSFLYLQTGSLALADIDLLLGGAAGIGSLSLINSFSTLSSLLGDSFGVVSSINSSDFEASN